MNNFPPEDTMPQTALTKIDVVPADPSDRPSLWRQFINCVRQSIGLKPLELSIRFVEAEVQRREAEAESQEVDNYVKLLKAKLEYDLIQAEIRHLDLQSDGQSKKAIAEEAKIRVETRSQAALCQIQEAAAREIARRDQTPAEAIRRFEEVLDKIRNCGGCVNLSLNDDDPDVAEIQKPPPKG
ncbi:MAG: hypothetical protein AABP62_06945 [Planctomycetota bacterium]